MRIALLIAGLLAVLHGRALAEPDLRIVEPVSEVLDFGAINAGTTSAPARIQIKNFGDALTSAPVVRLFGGGPFAIVGSGGSLGPGETAFWDIVATAGHGDRGPASVTFLFDYFDTTSISLFVSVRCVVRGTPLDAPRGGFGRIGPGTSQARTLTVTNTSPAPLTITALQLSAAAPFALQPRAAGLPITLAPEAAFDLDVTFAPPLPDKFYDLQLQAVLGDGRTIDVTELFGGTTGLVALEGALAWEGVPIGETWARQAALVNYGDAPQTVSIVALTNPGEFAFPGLHRTVVPGHARVPIAATFTPGAEFGRRSDYRISLSNASDLTGALGGFGAAARVRITTQDAAPDDGVLDFGDVELGSAPVTRQVTLTNISDAMVFLDACEQILGDGLAATAGCPHDVLLAPGASTQYGVVLTPSQLGDPTGRLTFSAVGVNATLELPVYAHVARHALAVSATGLAFADTVRRPGAPTTLTLTITNRGSGPIAVPDAVVSGAGFLIVMAPPPGVIPVDGSVSYTVGFAPGATATFDAALVLGPVAAPLATIPLHGVGTDRPVSAEPALNFGAIAVGAHGQQTLTVHNAGAVAVRITSIESSDPRFAVAVPADPAVPAGGDRTIQVAYTPTAAGADAATIEVGFDDDPDPQLVVAVDGAGLVTTTPDEPVEMGGGCSAGGGGANLLLALAAGGLLRRRRAVSAAH